MEMFPSAEMRPFIVMGPKNNPLFLLTMTPDWGLKKGLAPTHERATQESGLFQCIREQEQFSLHLQVPWTNRRC